MAAHPSHPLPAIISRTSAPGKLILFGEHAVVYGHDALAVSLSDLRVPAEVRLHPLGAGQATLTLSLPDTEAATAEPSAGAPLLAFAWPLAQVRASALCACLQAARAAAAPPASAASSSLPQALAPTPAMQAALAELVQGLPSPAHRRACTPLLFLACAILAQPLLAEAGALQGGLTLTVQPPTLPIGAGLGSSAAVSTACAAALLDALAQAAGQRLPQPLDAPALAAINAWAFSAETLFHGSPSGLDNTVATFGGALLYARRGGAPTFRPLRSSAALGSSALRLLLVNTRVPKDTAALVAGVAALRSQLPEVVNPLLTGIGALVARATAILEAAAGAKHGAAAAAAAPPPPLSSSLAALVRINHCTLNALGVGHGALDAVVAAAQRRGLAAKLTGAGGGGCAFVLLPDAEEQGAEEQGLSAELTALGFHCFTTRVGGEGVCMAAQ